MFPIGIALLFVGYACLYTGAANLFNGGTGPRLSQALGLKVTVAPPGADGANLIGPAPSTPSAPNPPR